MADMLIEHSVPGSTRMEALPNGAYVRIWLEKDKRFITIAPVNNGTSVLIQHFSAPGGFSYRQELLMSPDGYHSMVIK